MFVNICDDWFSLGVSDKEFMSWSNEEKPQDSIGTVDLLEHLLCLCIVRIFVRVIPAISLAVMPILFQTFCIILECKPPILLLDIFWCRVLRDV